MVHIRHIKFCNLYQIGFVTCTIFSLSLRKLSYDIYGLSVQIGTSLTSWMSLPSFVNRHVVVWWDIWQCGEDARIWNFNDVERTAVGSMPVATRQSSSGFRLELGSMAAATPVRQSVNAQDRDASTVFSSLFFLKRYCILFSEISFASCNWRSMQL